MGRISPLARTSRMDSRNSRLGGDVTSASFLRMIPFAILNHFLAQANSMAKMARLRGILTKAWARQYNHGEPQDQHGESDPGNEDPFEVSERFSLG